MVMGSTNIVLISYVVKASFEPKDGKDNEVAEENNPKGMLLIVGIMLMRKKIMTFGQ